MTASQSARGRQREVKVVDYLEEMGWVAVRAASGIVDVVAVPSSEALHPMMGRLVDPASLVVRGHVRGFSWLPLLVQVKSTAGPYSKFGPTERRELAELAEKCNAAAWLCWWPPHRQPSWIGQSDWPSS